MKKNTNLNQMRSKTQADLILNALQQGEAITPLESLQRFGCLRLGARIWDLKKKGHNIKTKIVKTATGKHVAQYFL